MLHGSFPLMESIHLTRQTAKEVDAQVDMQMKVVAMLFDMDMFDNQVTLYIALSCYQRSELLYLSLFIV
jgi:hypothetical protein